MRKMKTAYNYMAKAAYLVMAAALVSACQSDETIDNTDNTTPTVYTYHLTAGADIPATRATGGTRALSEDANSVLQSAWTKGDKMIAYNLSDNDKSEQASYNLLSSTRAGQFSPFDGELISVSSIKSTDNLCFFYPGAASEGTDRSIIPVEEVRANGENYYDRKETIKGTVELNLTKQDGTAKTIGERFDYQWAKVTPKSVNGKDVVAEIGPMQRKIAIWALRFADKQGRILTDIDSIAITSIKSMDAFNLNTGEYVSDNPNDESTGIMINASEGTKLTSAGGKYTYVAVMPGQYTDVLIMAYVGTKSYMRTFSAVTFEADKVYRDNVLGMEETTQQPYVEVQGVKWATGNFIHYVDADTQAEYWGIAPAQWWISQRAIKDDNDRTVSSQYVQDVKQTVGDVDLFRWGVIKDALTFNSGSYRDGMNDISKKFYNGSTLLASQVDKSKATFGDLPWYHTMDDNQKYRLPTAAEARTLYEKANVIPGFCYTDKGTKVYGAYFTTNNGEERKMTFPTRKNTFYKYSNVTAQVRANKGLFLPIAGRRSSMSDLAGYRYMYYFAGTYAQYMTAQGGTEGISWDLFFGPTEWNFSPNGRAQARAIRPVWDESSSTDPNPVFEPFKDIR